MSVRTQGYELFYSIRQYDCTQCHRLFSLMNVSQPNEEFFAYVLECTGCERRILLSMDDYPYTAIAHFFGNQRGEAFIQTLTKIIRCCPCGQSYELKALACPQCYHSAGDQAAQHVEAHKGTFYLARVFTLNEIKSLADPLLNKIFCNIEHPKNEQELERLSEAFAKNIPTLKASSK